ncbi:hypothetical protein D3C80_1295330 [compost metagenome]
MQTGAFDPRPVSQQQLVHQRRQRHLLFILQGLHLLDPGQVEQALDHLLQALALALDIAGKARALVGGHALVLQQLASPTNGCQRAFQLVSQSMHIALDIGLALQLGAHAFHRLGQVRQLAALVVRQRSPLTLADRLGITGQPAQRARQPPG